MALSKYCELDEVRAVLGLSDEELTDSVINLPIYEIGLVRELRKIAEALPGAFSTVASVPAESRTEAEQGLVDAVRLFAAASVAVRAGAPLGLLAPRSVSDGKASVTRFSDAPYKDALERAEGLEQDYRDNLASVYASYAGAAAGGGLTTPAVVFMASSRSYDPVTGV